LTRVVSLGRVRVALRRATLWESSAEPFGSRGAFNFGWW